MGATDGALLVVKYNMCFRFVLRDILQLSGKVLTLRIFAAMLVLLTVFSAFADSDDIKGFKTYNTRLPVYNKGRLQFILYSKQLKKGPTAIVAQDALIDIIRKGAKLDSLKYLDKTKPYPLDTAYEKIADFWLDTPHSEGYISTESSTISQQEKIANGDHEIFLRSPQLDLNGVGFTANFDKRTVTVLKDINIRVRMYPPTSEQSVDEKSRTIAITAQQMHADFSTKIIKLQVSVVANDRQFTMACDELVIDLNKADGEVKINNDVDDMSGGVSKITCIGNVRINRILSPEELQEGGKQYARADKAIYKTASGEIELLGKRPRLVRGKDFITGKRIVMWRTEERMKVFKNCRLKIRRQNKATTTEKKLPNKPTVITSDFMDLNYAENQAICVGNVHIEDPTLEVDCDKMTIFLLNVTEENKGNSTSFKPKEQVRFAEQSVEVGDVVINRTNVKGQSCNSNLPAVFLLKKGRLIFLDGQVAFLTGENANTGKIITFGLAKDSVKIDKQLTPTLDKLASGQLGENYQQRTVIERLAQDKSQQTVIVGTINIRKPNLSFNSDQIAIINSAAPLFAAPKIKKNTTTPFGDFKHSSGKKDIDKVICIGHVQLADPKAIINCDKMTMLFADRDKNALDKPSLGALGSGSNRELDKIYCDGNFRLETHQAKNENDTKTDNAVEDEEGISIQKMDHVIAVSKDAILDLPDNICKLLGDVKIYEPKIQLSCRRMHIITKDLLPGELDKEIELDEDELEANVPRRIAIGEAKKLTKIYCYDDVSLTRALADGEKQEAAGKQAVYSVFNRNIVLTGTKDKKPIMRQGDNIVEGDKITLWADSEKLDIKNSKIKMLDPEQLR